MTYFHSIRALTGADLPGVQWRTSTRTQNGGDCVELATAHGLHLARDSKDPNGPVLAFTGQNWSGFLGGVKSGKFDLS